MVGGGVDGLVVAVDLDVEVVEVGVPLDHDGLDGLGLGLAGRGVDGRDLVTGLEAGDRRCRAAGEDHRGGGGEGLAAASLDRVLRRSGFLRREARLRCGGLVAIGVESHRDAAGQARLQRRGNPAPTGTASLRVSRKA